MASETLGAFTPEDARMILDAVRFLKSQGFLRKDGNKPPNNVPPRTPRLFRNDTNETVPAYACMQVTGTYESGGQNYFTIQKPEDAAAEKGPYVFNHHNPVAPEEFGKCHDGVETRSLSTAPTASAGTRFAPSPGSWSVTANPEGMFVHAGPDDLGADVARIFIYGAGEGGRVDGTLRDCLYRSDSTGVVDTDDGPVEFDNQWLDDGMIGSDITLEQYTDSNGNTRWRPLRIARRKARWLEVTKSGSDWEVVAFHEGEDPEECGEDIICEFDCSCLEEGDKAYAKYDPNTDKYYVHASDSAVLGPADTINVIDGGSSTGGGDGLTADQCKINYTAQPIKAFTCGEEPIPKEMTLGVEPVTINSVSLSNTSDGGQLCITPVTVYVCDSSSGSPTCIPIEQQNCVPQTLCTGQAVWYWDGENWSEQTPCENGCTSTEPPFPGSAVGQTITVNCYEP